jgi:hypothetical protein
MGLLSLQGHSHDPNEEPTGQASQELLIDAREPVGRTV